MAQFRVPVLEHFSWQEPVISILSTPPGSPAKGDRYIVGESPTGDFTGEEHSIAWYDGTDWVFDSPSQGWTTHNKDDDKQYVFNGTAWGAEDISSKMDLVSGATEDNLASFDDDGQVKDSGVSTSDVASAVNDSHAQNTDQALDQGGANEVTAAQAKEAYDKRANFDSDLNVLLFDL